MNLLLSSQDRGKQWMQSGIKGTWSHRSKIDQESVELDIYYRGENCEPQNFCPQQAKQWERRSLESPHLESKIFVSNQ